MSAGRPPERHRGVSHHSTTAYGRVALAPADVVVPRASAALVDHAAFARHRLVQVDDEDLLAVLAPWAPLLSTMGRGLADDPLAFVARPPPAATPRHCWTERVGYSVVPAASRSPARRRPPRPRDGRPGARAPRRPARRRR
jgi:hypothetical protein